jgi:hypothetical protein
LDILVEADDADGLGDVDDVFLVPDRHGRRCEGRVAAFGSWLLVGSESRVVATDGAVVMLRWSGCRDVQLDFRIDSESRGLGECRLSRREKAIKGEDCV